MTMSPDYPERPPAGMSSDKKTLIGCGIGCAVIVGIVLIVAGFAGWWLFSQEDQAPTDRILTTDSSAAFRLEDISQNREVMQLITDVSGEAQRIGRKDLSGLPPFIEEFNKYFEDKQDAAKVVEWIAPKEATLSISSDEAGNTNFLIAANFGKGTRIPKLFLNSAFESNEELKNKKISTEHGDLFLFEKNNDWNNDKSDRIIIGFYKGTFILGNDPESAISALDQLADEGNAGRLKGTLSDPFYRMGREGSLAYGVLDGSQLKTLNHGTGTFNDELGSQMKKAEVSLDKLSGEKGVVSLNIDWNSKEFAAKANEEIEKLKTEWIRKVEEKGLEMEVINTLNDEQLDIRFQVNNLKDTLIYMMQNMN